MTNYEKIRKEIDEMGIEQFAKVFCDYQKDCDECLVFPLCNDTKYDPKNPYKCAIKWFKSEVRE